MMNSPRAGSLNDPRPAFDSAAAAALSAWAATPRAAAPLRNARLLILACMVDLREEGITLAETLPCWRADQWDRLALVAPVDAEVFAIDRDHAVSGMKLAQANQAEVRQVWMTGVVSRPQPRHLRKGLPAVEGQGHHAGTQHREH